MPVSNLSPQEVQRLLARGEAVLVDVREPAEYHAAHIASAHSLPLSRLKREDLPNKPGQKCVIHCQKGGRGQSACNALLAQDPGLVIYHLEGGLEAWEKAGFAVVRSGKAHLPLDRQVQLTIGLVLILASVVGYFSTPSLFWLTGLVGAGLTFAGLTGFCGLAKLLARMPWNHQSAGSSCCTGK